MDPVKGKTLRWTFADGPMAGKVMDHTFSGDGTVRWREAGATAAPGPESTAAYQVEVLNDEVYAVSYLSAHGWTLTTVVDTKAGKLVSFASNEKQLVLQRGRSAEAKPA